RRTPPAMNASGRLATSSVHWVTFDDSSMPRRAGVARLFLTAYRIHSTSLFARPTDLSRSLAAALRSCSASLSKRRLTRPARHGQPVSELEIVADHRPLDRDAPLLRPALELPGPSTAAGRRAHADAVVLEQVGWLLRRAAAREVRRSACHHEACGIRKPDLD